MRYDVCVLSSGGAEAECDVTVGGGASGRQQLQRGTETAAVPRARRARQQQAARARRGHRQRRPQVSICPEISRGISSPGPV